MADEREFSVVAERSPVRRRSPAFLTDKSLTGEQIAGDREQACKSKNTKTHELTFHAVLSDGARELRFERLRAQYGSRKAAGRTWELGRIRKGHQAAQK